MMTLKRIMTPFALLVALAGPAVAQEWRGGHGRLEGTVTNAKGEPIEGATVQLRWSTGKGPDVKTNKKGHWAVLGIVDGKWDIDVLAPGYQTRKLSAQVSEAERSGPIDVKLEPEVKVEPKPQEITIGGKKVSKETADAVEGGNNAWAEADKAKQAEDACASPATPGQDPKACADAAEARRQESLKQAVALYEKAIGELSDSVPILTRLEIGNYWMHQGDGALKYAHMLAEKDPSEPTNWLMIAEIQLQKGNLDEGKEALGKVPDEKITDPQPYMNMGILYYNKNRPAEAEEYFTKAIQKRDTDAEPYYYRGLARYQLKRKGEAKADFEKYLQLAPSGKDADTARELLKTIK